MLKMQKIYRKCFCNVLLNITGGTQNKVKIRPEFAASLNEESFRTISISFLYIQLIIWSSEDQN